MIREGNEKGEKWKMLYYRSPQWCAYRGGKSVRRKIENGEKGGARLEERTHYLSK